MTFQILALSGGGYLGLFSAHILAQLEEQAERPLGRCFDLICGTSIGGILGLGLANEVPAAKILQAFESRGPEIFPQKPRRLGYFSDLIQFGFRPKYDGRALRCTIEDILGPATLLGEAKHRVLIPTVNMTEGKIQVFKTPHHEDFHLDHRKRMVDIAMATSAAPLYFPMAEIGDALYVDGGLFANAPDLCGLHEAEHFLKIPRSEISILSIGTTTSSYSLPHSLGRNFGALKWMGKQRIVSTVMSAQQQLTDFIIRHQLGDRYLRLDKEQTEELAKDLGLDKATDAARRTIKGVAQAVYQANSTKPLMRTMLKHNVSEPNFYHGPRAATRGAEAI